MASCLDDFLYKPKWNIQDNPFPHIYTTSVFNQRTYLALCRDFNKHLKAKLRNTPKESINQDGLHIIDIYEKPGDAIDLFVSDQWINLFSSLFNISLSKFVSLGLHYHQPNSSSGLVHNDLTHGWFLDNSDSSVILPSINCRYTDGKTSQGLRSVVHTARAITIIFYLDNPEAEPLIGGGTGLYSHAFDDITKPVIVIPPINNSMLIFPCTPTSFHAFISNINFPRRSIIMWLHVPVEWAVSKWGKNAIQEWN